MENVDSILLKKAIQKLVVALNPEKIYLYGSQAYGQPNKDSDIDLLIIVAESNLPVHKRAAQAYRSLKGLFIPADIKVVTRSEFEKYARWFSSIERVVLEKGQLLYESQRT